MAQFSWTDDLHTGNALIDGDHRELIGLINTLFQAMEGGESGAALGEAMRALIGYSAQHFAREEAEMERIGYVAALAHRTEHAKLLMQVTELQEMLDAGRRINVPAVSAFLGDWLRDHILAADMKLAAALRRQLSPAPAAQLQ